MTVPERHRYKEPAVVPNCIPPELQKALALLSTNDRELLQPLERIIEQIIDNSVSNFAAGNAGPVFNNFSGPLPEGSNPTRLLKATSNMASQKCNAKYYDWDPDTDTYAVVGDAFEIYDVFNRWSHSKTNDLFLGVWDSIREAVVIIWADTPMTRRGTIGTALAASGGITTATATDEDDGTTHTVDGWFVPSGKKIPSGSRVKFDYNVKAETWFVDVTNVCVVPI